MSMSSSRLRRRRSKTCCAAWTRNDRTPHVWRSLPATRERIRDASLIAGLIGVGQNYLVTVMGQSVMFDLRNQMYDRVLRQSLRFFTQTKSGEILSRLQNDVGGVQGVVTGTLVSLVTNTMVVVSTL